MLNFNTFINENSNNELAIFNSKIKKIEFTILNSKINQIFLSPELFTEFLSELDGYRTELYEYHDNFIETNDFNNRVNVEFLKIVNNIKNLEFILESFIEMNEKIKNII